MAYEKSEPSNELTKKLNTKASPAKWLSWVFVGLVVVTTLWGINQSFSQKIEQVNTPELLAGILFQSLPIIFSILAALIINRQPANIVGWLMAITVLGGVIDNLTAVYFRNILTPPTAPSFLFLLLLWANNVSWTLIIFPIILIPLFFPNGRPPSPRWNWVIYYASGMLIFFYGVTILAEGLNAPGEETRWIAQNPIGFLSDVFLARAFDLPWTLALGILTIACMASLVVRYRRGSPVEQAQIKWVVYSSLFFAIVYVVALSISFNSEDQSFTFVSIIIEFLFAASSLSLPVGISIAILRYRLWDIDFVINRSLVYGALTALLVALLGGGLYVVSHLFQNFAGGPLVAVAVSASVFGAIFQPVRRQLQRFVDRRFYNIHIDYQKTQPPVPSESPTQVLRRTQFGAYRDLELVGKGGMAEVYRSIHPSLNVPVAIKILPEHLATDAEFRKRFVREAEVVAGLEHPNIVRIFDSGEQGGTFYMVMEFLTGKDLDQLIKKNGRLSIQQALPLIRQIASALDYAHARGCVHRDIKPSNILLDADSNKDGRVVLTDFGIAKIMDARTAMTRTGYMLGTFDYIAPEQIEESSAVDGRADIYSLGVMTYQMLTGELPFKQVHPGALLIAHLNQPPPDACERTPGLSGQVGSVIQQAMAKKPEERFASAGEFVLGMS